MFAFQGVILEHSGRGRWWPASPWPQGGWWLKWEFGGVHNSAHWIWYIHLGCSCGNLFSTHSALTQSNVCRSTWDWSSEFQNKNSKNRLIIGVCIPWVTGGISLPARVFIGYAFWQNTKATTGCVTNWVHHWHYGHLLETELYLFPAVRSGTKWMAFLTTVRNSPLSSKNEFVLYHHLSENVLFCFWWQTLCLLIMRVGFQQGCLLTAIPRRRIHHTKASHLKVDLSMNGECRQWRSALPQCVRSLWWLGKASGSGTSALSWRGRLLATPHWFVSETGVCLLRSQNVHKKSRAEKEICDSRFAQRAVSSSN